MYSSLDELDYEGDEKTTKLANPVGKNESLRNLKYDSNSKDAFFKPNYATFENKFPKTRLDTSLNSV